MHSLEFSPSSQNESVYREILRLRQLREKMKSQPFQSVGALDAFFKLVKGIGENLSTYDTILSDDASGRLVSLVLRDVINEARKRKGVEGGVNTYFFATGRHDGKEVIKLVKDFLKNKSEIKKALVVTEHIATGKSIMQLTNILDDLGINFNIATLSTTEKRTFYPLKMISRLYIGAGESMAGGSFYHEPDYTGVEKKSSSDTPHPIKRTVMKRNDIANARQDATMLAEELKKIIV